MSKPQVIEETVKQYCSRLLNNMSMDQYYEHRENLGIDPDCVMDDDQIETFILSLPHWMLHDLDYWEGLN